MRGTSETKVSAGKVVNFTRRAGLNRSINSEIPNEISIKPRKNWIFVPRRYIPFVCVELFTLFVFVLRGMWYLVTRTLLYLIDLRKVFGSKCLEFFLHEIKIWFYRRLVCVRMNPFTICLIISTNDLHKYLREWKQCRLNVLSRICFKHFNVRNCPS